MNTGNSILELPIEDLVPNSFRQRLVIDDTSLSDLAESIKIHGIIQPIVVRRKEQKYEIIAGERRYRAAKIAGLLKVPALLTNLNEKQIAELSIVENVQRKSLNAIEEAKSYKTLLEKGLMSISELANKMGVSETVVNNKLKLLDLDVDVQDALLNDKISERHARSLLKIPDLSTQKQYLNQVIDERLTVKQLEDLLKKLFPENPPTIKLPETASVPADMQVPQMPENNYSSHFFNNLESQSANMEFGAPVTAPVMVNNATAQIPNSIAPTVDNSLPIKTELEAKPEELYSGPVSLGSAQFGEIPKVQEIENFDSDIEML